jgi:biopolymer transport protein ExbB
MMQATAQVWLAQDSNAERGMSWLEIVQSGGVVGFVILGLSMVALALIVMHLIQIRRRSLLPPVQIEELDRALSRGDINSAVAYCIDPANDSYITRILGAGLTRFQKSAFGVFEIKNAIEEAGEDQTARLYRSTDALGVIGSIAPLLGLLGTVLGMVGAFNSLSRSSGGNNHEELASNISLALVTTLMGLILAIPCVALFTFFRNRIDSLASEAGMEIERLVLHLESGQSPPVRQAPTAGRPMPAPTAGPTTPPSARPAPLPTPGGDGSATP